MPKGFNRRAQKGLMEFLEASYEYVLEVAREGGDVEQAIEEELEEIRSFLETFDEKVGTRASG